MNILFVAAEATPFAKIGGLADVAGSLPAALKAPGHDVRIVMPTYQMITDRPGLRVDTAQEYVKLYHEAATVHRQSTGYGASAD